jgi:2-phospho-L-lactate guanylyltransferase
VVSDQSAGGQGPGEQRTWAAVPFKGPVGTKRRLAVLLDPDERALLSRAMLADVLGALLGTPTIERVLLLTPDGGADDLIGRGAGGLLSDPRLTLLDEPAPEANGTDGAGRDGLNEALWQAQAVATAAGADSLLIVPADLPLVRPADIAALLRVAPSLGIVVAPDRAAGGTNALLLSPPSAMTTAFGVDSFARHRALATEAGLPSAVVERPGLALDLDTPADVAALLASGRTSNAVQVLRELAIPERLARLAPAEAQARSATI